MDGIDDPPLMQALHAQRLNTFLDALYFVPQRDRQAAAAAASRRARARRRSTSSAPATCRSSVLDPALTRPGRMGRHIYFRTPTWEDRRDIFDLYLGKVAHDEELDTPAQARRAGAHHQRLLARR